MTTFPRAKRRLRSSASWLSTQVKLAKQLEACVCMYMGAKFVMFPTRLLICLANWALPFTNLTTSICAFHIGSISFPPSSSSFFSSSPSLLCFSCSSRFTNFFHLNFPKALSLSIFPPLVQLFQGEHFNPSLLLSARHSHLVQAYISSLLSLLSIRSLKTFTPRYAIRQTPLLRLPKSLQTQILQSGTLMSLCSLATPVGTTRRQT